MDVCLRLTCCLAGVVAAACEHGGREQAPFRLARTSPPPADAPVPPLLLNDAITAYFTAPVLPVSVTPDSVTVVDNRGHRVPGDLRVGADWITFMPLPPVTASLDDGSFRPGGAYELRIAGMPRPDAIRAIDGRRLTAPVALPFRVAGRDDAPSGLPAPLRPPANELPFVLRPPDGLLQLPADAPRLRLDFTQPVLPSSVSVGAFEITLLDQPPFETLTPRSVRIVPPRRSGRRSDELDGAAVEIDLGAAPARAGGEPRPLRAGDRICLQLRGGIASLRDHRGTAPLAAPPQLWSVVAGDQVPYAEWPSAGDVITASDGLSPTFEAHAGGLRPRLRVECGDGRLGVLRPQRDLVLRPGEPFDRGDGAIVVSDGGRFPFLAIDIPAGVTVRVDAGNESACLMAVGSVRIAGALVAMAPPGRQLERRFQAVSVLELAAMASVAVIAGGGIELAGWLSAEPPPGVGQSTWTLASAGPIDLRSLQGELPFQTVLAVDAAIGDGRTSLLGVRGQSLVVPAVFTYGLPAGASVRAEALLPWRPMPVDRILGVLRTGDPEGRVSVHWQTAPPDPVRLGWPDTSAGRVSRLEPARDGEPLPFAAGDFVRCQLSLQVAAGDAAAAIQPQIVGR